MKRYLQRVADTLADKEGDDEWRTVDLDRLYNWGIDLDRSIEENANDLLDQSVRPHHIGQRETQTQARKTTKTTGQLNREINDALGVLRWKKTGPGAYRATSTYGDYTIDGNNAGRNRWTVTYPDGDYGMVDSLAEAKAWGFASSWHRAFDFWAVPFLLTV